MTDPHPIDFIGHPYPVRRQPRDDAARSVDLLLATFDAVGRGTAGRRLADALVDRLGTNRTVWGVKTGPAGLSWELYWYDDRPDRRALTYADAASAVAAGVELDAPRAVDEELAYVSVSFEVHRTELGLVADTPSLYFGESADSGRSVGLSYELTSQRVLHLRNTYQTFDPIRADEARRLARFIERSARCAGNGPTAAWLTNPNAATIILARKPRTDALYFRRVDMSTALDLPGNELVEPELRRALDRFDVDHLFVDCGLDYEEFDGVPSVQRFCLFGYL